MTEGYPLPPIRDNRSDAPDPSIRIGRDRWPAQGSEALTRAIFWPVFLPLACAEFGAAVGMNCLQAAEMVMTRRLR